MKFSEEKPKKKLHMVSLGCTKNLVDSEVMLGKLKDYELTDDESQADLIIVNTCGFIGDAKQESIDTILEVAQLKEKKLKKLIVAGCLAQRYAAELMEELPEVDAIIGTGDIDKIEAVVDDIFREKRVIRSDSLEFLANAATERILTTHPHTAYLKIAEGCDRKCTYCIIPKLRGKLRSRSIEDIVEEAKKLSAMGVRELNLLAQETSEYGIDRYGDKSLARLLRELVKVEGIKWIRNYYMFPNSVTDELIETIRDEEKVCSYFDISIQHVASNVLQAMKRAKDSTQIKGVLAKIRKEIPDASIRTTVIVGFPGETEEDFIELKEFIEEFKFDYVGVFKYSREEDTEAHDLLNQVDDETKERRYVELVNLQSQIAENKNKQYIGKEIEVMIDSISSESEFMLEGRTKGQALEIDGKVLTNDGTGKPGEIVKVLVEQNFEYDLLGPIIRNKDN